MAEHSLELVSFQRPPVEEVALAVQLVDPVFSFDQLVLLDQQLRETYPLKEFQPQLGRMAINPEPLFQFGQASAMPRIWWLTKDGHYVVQAQADRIVLNWRGLGRSVPYPRYKEVRRRFEHLQEAATAITGERAPLDLIEVTYVNELRPTGVAASKPLGSFLRTVRFPENAKFLQSPTDTRWAAKWAIDPTPEGFSGALEANAEPALSRHDQHPVYLLTMTCRLTAAHPLLLADSVGPLDLAHEWIVRGFADITTPEMHQQWERTR